MHGPGRGKGNALWASLLVSLGDVVVWCDGDLTSFEPDWIPRLAAPLLVDPGIGLVKASYRRPTDTGGGGRTTELVARPLLSLYYPELARLDQPLAGEYAVRAATLDYKDLTPWAANLKKGVSGELSKQFDVAVPAMQQILTPIRMSTTAASNGSARASMWVQTTAPRGSRSLSGGSRGCAPVRAGPCAARRTRRPRGTTGVLAGLCAKGPGSPAPSAVGPPGLEPGTVGL